jgi:predicted DCC family thiol-disulfide oxidoreductase YuxK
MESQPPLVLFDGVCNLCNGAVRFLIDRDPDASLRFASLQSEAGRAALHVHGGVVNDGDPDTMVLIEDGHMYERSTAALRIARHLRRPYKWLYAFVLVPRVWRDVVYGWVARHRYRWFGRTDVCRVPTPELRARFLSEPSRP